MPTTLESFVRDYLLYDYSWNGIAYDRIPSPLYPLLAERVRFMQATTRDTPPCVEFYIPVRNAQQLSLGPCGTWSATFTLDLWCATGSQLIEIAPLISDRYASFTSLYGAHGTGRGYFKSLFIQSLRFNNDSNIGGGFPRLAAPLTDFQSTLDFNITYEHVADDPNTIP